MQITIGLDNGQSGSIAIIGDGAPSFAPIPTKDALHYGKKGTVGQRLDRDALKTALRPSTGYGQLNPIRAYVERPFTGRFMNAVIPAQRFFEATIITLEDMGIGYEVVDSGVWQKPMLGNVKTSAALKKASLLRGIQLYPQLEAVIRKHKDADGLLIAHYFHHAHA